MKKELLDHTLDEAFANLFDEVKKSEKNVCVSVCVTDGKDVARTRMAMHGEQSGVLAAICLAINEYAERTHHSTTEVLLKIASAMSEEE